MKQNFLMQYSYIFNFLKENTILGSAPAAIKIIMQYYYPHPIKPVILGISGTKLTESEALLLKTEHPLGVVLFRRNIESEIIRDPKTGEIIKVIQNKEQLIGLITSIKEELGEHTVIAIDQEGGRVRRLTVPTFEMRPAAESFDKYELEEGSSLCKQNYQSIAIELESIGVNMNFAPVADVRYKGAHDVIGDRSFSSTPKKVISFCKAALEGMCEVGISGVIKHIPGHGRSVKDSHLELPVVSTSLKELEETDFSVFRALGPFSQFAMTSHIIYTALDDKFPVTLSKKAIQYIREEIGFKGLIISDAIDMRALADSYTPAKIAQLTLEAGVDIILECTGDINNMQAVLGAVNEISLETLFSF